MENIETLRWNKDHLEMIDQRILPSNFEYISLSKGFSIVKKGNG